MDVVDEIAVMVGAVVVVRVVVVGYCRGRFGGYCAVCFGSCDCESSR